MARVVKRAVYGTLPTSSRSSRVGRNRTKHHYGQMCSTHYWDGVQSPDFDPEASTDIDESSSSSSTVEECSPKRKNGYLRYEESSDEDDDSCRGHERQFSRNFADLISQRGLWGPLARVSSEYSTRHLLVNGNFRERWIRLGEMNKIFCSKWLNDRQIVFGSKCNKLSVYDTSKRELFTIPLLRSRAIQPQNSQYRRPASDLERDVGGNNQCGIHSIAVNPSQTVLATGTENTNDVAFYSLPTFDPLAIGEGAHEDWTFDLQWLDDAFLVSGSRDTTMALWKLPDRCLDAAECSANYEGEPNSNADEEVGRITHFKSLAVKRCKTAEKVRALAFNRREGEVAALSLNGYIHLWKADTFKQMGSQKLSHGMETVCLGYQEERNVYAVGSRSHTTILDARSLQPIQDKNIASLNPTCGIRSVSFRGDLLTIGTGTGSILFYDLRASKYLTYRNCQRDVVFNTNTGWVASDESPQAGVRYTPAVYTHCYDESGTRLFAAGGPLAVERRGNYAALWS